MKRRLLNEAEREYVSDLITEYKMFLRKSMEHLFSSMSKQDIEDCLQELYFVAYNNYDTLKKHENKAGWLYVSLKNIINSLYRKNKKRNLHTVPLENAEYELANNFFEDDAIFKILVNNLSDEELSERITATLTETEKTIYKLKYIDNKSNTYIASALNIGENTVRARCSDIHKKIEKIIYKSQLHKYVQK